MAHISGRQLWVRFLDPRNRAICATPLCYGFSLPRRPLRDGDSNRASKSTRSYPLRPYTRRSAFNSATTSSNRGSQEIMSLPLVGKELALVSDPDAVAFRMLDPLQVHPEVDCTHDAVSELLVDQSLYGGAVDLRNLVYPVDGGVHGNVGVQ